MLIVLGQTLLIERGRKLSIELFREMYTSRPNLDDATSLQGKSVGAGRRPVQASAYTIYYSTIQNTYNDTHNLE